GAVDAPALLEENGEPLAGGFGLGVVLPEVQERLDEPVLMIKAVLAQLRLDARLLWSGKWSHRLGGRSGTNKGEHQHCGQQEAHRRSASIMSNQPNNRLCG